MAEVKAKKRGVRKDRKGEVISKSGDRSIVVQVERRRRHPLYKKVIKQFSKYHVHDEKNEAKVGDMVRILETRPISKLKRWRLAEIIGGNK